MRVQDKMEEGMKFKFEKKDVIFWICIIGAITSLILNQFYGNSPPFEEVAFAFVVGSLLYLYAAVADIKVKIGEMKGKLELMPTSEDVRGIIV